MKIIPYLKLLSELFRWSKLIQKLGSLGHLDLGIKFGQVLTVELLDNMKITLHKGSVQKELQYIFKGIKIKEIKTRSEAALATTQSLDLGGKRLRSL